MHLPDHFKPLLQPLRAAWPVLSQIRLTHQRPSDGIPSVQIGGRLIPVHEETVHSTPFGTLLRFVREGLPPARRAAAGADRGALCGHFATLLVDRVRTMLGDHDVYFPGGPHARDVPLSLGRLGLDEDVHHGIWCRVAAIV